MDAINRLLIDLARTVRIADAIDVLLVALFLYIVISWVRQSSSGSASRRLTVVGVLFAAIYLLATIFDLYLVERLLGGLLIVFLFAAVVVFASDIRRLLDRIGEWGFSRRGAAIARSSGTVGTLTEAAAKLAEERTGAIIALRGREPWASYIQGGVPLQGEISRPLLYSIFDPDTAGHDGAVLVEGNEITSFAAHLPLARRLPEASRFGGTRHAAALGLSEECDAFVIVVSEERGTISVAQNGELTVMDSPSELGDRLERFWRDHYSTESAVRTEWRTRRSLQTALASLALAVVAWFVFAYSPVTVQRTYDVPIAFRNVPSTWVLQRDTVRETSITLVGSEQAFQALDETELVVTFDLSDLEPGVNELVIGEDNIELPSELDLYGAQPQELMIYAEPHEAMTLPIRVRTTGTVPDSLRLVPVPDTVTLLVPPDQPPPESVPTEPIDLERATGGRIVTTLAPPPDTHLPPGRSGALVVRVVPRPVVETQ